MGRWRIGKGLRYFFLGLKWDKMAQLAYRVSMSERKDPVGKGLYSVILDSIIKKQPPRGGLQKGYPEGIPYEAVLLVMTSAQIRVR